MSEQPKAITSIEDLTPDRKNLNRGTERGNGLIEKSFERYGAGRSILVDRDGNVIAGNKSLGAWVGIGTERIRVVQTDGHELVVVQRTDLTIDSKAGRELAISDNRAGELNLAWDVPAMEQLAGDFDIDLRELGFTPAELRRLGDEEADAAGIGSGEGKEITCPHCGAVFTPGDRE